MSGEEFKQFATSIDVGVTSTGVGIRFVNDKGHTIILDLSSSSANRLMEALKEAIALVPEARA